jgi:DNA-binding GntR family transcriptional regulator
MEGFVTIKSRRGIYVNDLSLEEIGQFYQLIGALEQSALLVAYPQMGPKVIGEMRILNNGMKQALEEDEFDRFYVLNLAFHNTFLQRSQNPQLIRIVDNLKKRLYDFPSQETWLKDWEMASVSEHEQVVTLLDQGDVQAAARFIHDVHWGFNYQKGFIERYYFPGFRD